MAVSLFPYFNQENGNPKRGNDSPVPTAISEAQEPQVILTPKPLKPPFYHAIIPNHWQRVCLGPEAEQSGPRVTQEQAQVLPLVDAQPGLSQRVE